jgi:hypothetical protein
LRLLGLEPLEDGAHALADGGLMQLVALLVLMALLRVRDFYLHGFPFFPLSLASYYYS